MEKTLWKKIMALVLAVCLMASLIPAGVMAKEDTPKTYLELGDSISAGYRLGEDEPAFTQIIAKEHGYNLDRHAKSGETTVSLMEKLPTLQENIKNADLITLTIGGNDMLYALYTYLADQYSEQTGQTVTPDQMKEWITGGGDKAREMLLFAATVITDFPDSKEAAAGFETLGKNLEKIVDDIVSNNKEVSMIVATQYNPYIYLARDPQLNEQMPEMAKVVQLITKVFEDEIHKMNDTITTVSEEKGFVVADVHTAFENSEAILTNPSYTPPLTFDLDFHPNADGHAMIAQVMEPPIQELENTWTLDEAENSIMSLQDKIAGVDQSVANTEESAKAWAESLITPVLPEGVTAVVNIDSFEAAEAGTKDNPEGKDGTFDIVVVLSCNETVREVVVGPVTVKATAYTAPQEAPTQDTTADQTTTATTTKTSATTSPKTGTASTMMPVILMLLLAAGASATVLAGRRK